MLTAKLRESSIECHESPGDADILVVRTAIDKSSSGNNVIIVGEDVDFMVLLTALTPKDREILFVKPSHFKLEPRFSPHNSYKNRD